MTKEILIKEIVTKVRQALPHLTDKERVELWNALQEDYCPDCGRHTGDATCHCENDD
jgi:hypothetical protein